MAKPGLYSNIAAKKKRIKAGSGEKMRKKGDKGAPAKGAFKVRPRRPRSLRRKERSNGYFKTNSA